MSREAEKYNHLIDGHVLQLNTQPHGERKGTGYGYGTPLADSATMSVRKAEYKWIQCQRGHSDHSSGLAAIAMAATDQVM